MAREVEVGGFAVWDEERWDWWSWPVVALWKFEFEAELDYCSC